MPDIEDSEASDREHLADLRKRIAQGESDLAFMREHKEALDAFYNVLEGAFSRLSSGRPRTVRLASLLPFSMRNAFFIGWVAERIRINIAIAGRMALLAFAVDRQDAQATIKYLELNLKDDKHNEKLYTQILEKQRASPFSP